MRLEPTTLHGRHVRLEPLSLSHAPALLAAADHDRSTYGYTPVPDSLERMEAYINGLLADAERDSAKPFAQVRTVDDTPVGCTRYLNMLWWPDRTTPAEVEIGGTWLSADAQRTPINTEAKFLLLQHAFEDLRVFRVAIMTDALNARSRAAIERLGATFEGIVRKHRPNAGSLTPAGQPRNTAAYSIIDDEWPIVRDRLAARLRHGTGGEAGVF